MNESFGELVGPEFEVGRKVTGTAYSSYRARGSFASEGAIEVVSRRIFDRRARIVREEMVPGQSQTIVGFSTCSFYFQVLRVREGVDR